MKVAIVGSRKLPQSALDKVTAYVQGMLEDTWIISGGAEGVDITAERAARYMGFPVTVFAVGKVGLPPYPEGKSEFRDRAFARNLRIAEECDRMVAFWDGKSGGTWNAMEHAKCLGKPVEMIKP